MRYPIQVLGMLIISASFATGQEVSSVRSDVPAFVPRDILLAAGSDREMPIVDDDLELSEFAKIELGIKQALKKNGSVDYDETEFMDVLSDLTDQLGINIVLTASARDDSLSEDEPITIKLSNVPYESILRLMLRNYNATYIVRDGVMRIISLDVADRPEYFRFSMFECQNLLRLMIVAEDIVVRDAASSKPETAGNAEMNAQRIASDMLVELIQSYVAPDTWEDSNGSGKIKICGTLMLISQSETASQAVRVFLNDFEFKLRQVVRNKQM